MAMPQFGNSTMRLRAGQQLNEHSEYQVSGWVDVKTPWNDALGKPEPAPPHLQEKLDQALQLLQECNAQLSFTIKQKTGGDPQGWPIAGKMNVYTNTPQEKRLPKGLSKSYVAPPATQPWEV